MSIPRITVAMSVYNNGSYVGAAIDSILAQSFGDFEFLIVNDGSTDESAAVIDARAATDSRIRVIHQENKGFIASLNRMFAEARSPWIARMDGDDVSHPNRIARQLAFVEAHPNHGVVSCASELIGPDGKVLNKEIREKPLTHDAIFANLEDGPLINHNAALMARDPVIAVGGYRTAYRHCEDYDLWLRLIDRTRFANLSDKLVSYRIYPEQVSNRHLVEQARNAAISWQARLERLAGRPDPTKGLDALPSLHDIDALFGRAGVATYVRMRVVNRMLYSPEALSGDGHDILLDYITETGAEARIWRAAARLMKSGRLRQAAQVSGALLRAC